MVWQLNLMYVCYIDSKSSLYITCLGRQGCVCYARIYLNERIMVLLFKLYVCNGVCCYIKVVVFCCSFMIVIWSWPVNVFLQLINYFITVVVTELSLITNKKFQRSKTWLTHYLLNIRWYDERYRYQLSCRDCKTWHSHEALLTNKANQTHYSDNSFHVMCEA